MEAKISQAQIEVLEWKENLYDEIKSIPRSKKLKYIREKVQFIVDQIKKNKES